MAHLFQNTAFGMTFRALFRGRMQSFPNLHTENFEQDTPSTGNTSSREAGPSILVDWNSEIDPENPHNWSTRRKSMVTVLICIYTFTVYFGSSIYVPGVGQVMEQFDISETLASLGLALYVLGYGIGPLLFSPLSEIPCIGRNPIYIITFTIFILLTIGTALCDSFSGFLALRFLQGLFGSPCLATGAATLTDMFSVVYIPYSLSAWSAAMYCGPALGPLASSFAITVKGWRWSMWELLWLSGLILLPLFFLLPETSTPTLLYHKARRLRANGHLEATTVDTHPTTKRPTRADIVKLALIKPFEITLKDPAIAFVNIYTSFTYGIYYSFFEVFPLVYPKIYGMSLGESSAVFVCILVACALGSAWYCLWYRVFFESRFHKLNTFDKQETFLRPGLTGVFGVTGGMFLFGWAARSSIHWIVPTIGIVMYCGCGFVVGLGIFIYMPLTYPQYAASLFAANDALRSTFAAAAVLFARPLYTNLGVAEGCSLLGSLSVLGIVGFWYLFMYGERLRERSKFTE